MKFHHTLLPLALFLPLAACSKSEASPPKSNPTDAAAPATVVKRYLLAGLLVWLPLAITIWVLGAILGTLDSVFATVLTWAQAVLPSAASPLPIVT